MHTLTLIDDGNQHGLFPPIGERIRHVLYQAELLDVDVEVRVVNSRGKLLVKYTRKKAVSKR